MSMQNTEAVGAGDRRSRGSSPFVYCPLRVLLASLCLLALGSLLGFILAFQNPLSLCHLPSSSFPPLLLLHHHHHIDNHHNNIIHNNNNNNNMVNNIDDDGHLHHNNNFLAPPPNTFTISQPSPIIPPSNFTSLSIPLFNLQHGLSPHHNLTDPELLWLSSRPPSPPPSLPLRRVPKIAFMFLSKGALPLAPLWERFFKGNEDFYSIYLHTDPRFTLEVSPSSVFYHRQIPSKITRYGDIGLLNSERRLLANALLDSSNEKFVLLSESCIPIYNFSMVYDYILKSNYSFIESYDEVGPCGRGRYKKEMAPFVTMSYWRKGSQWFEVDRNLARHVVSDTFFHALFDKSCKMRCFHDEHYIPTLFNIMDLGSQLAYRSITWVDWSKRVGPHPTTFQGTNISEVFLRSIKEVKNCSYNAEDGHICFLFARKFASSTLTPLLELAPNVLGI